MNEHNETLKTSFHRVYRCGVARQMRYAAALTCIVTLWPLMAAAGAPFAHAHANALPIAIANEDNAASSGVEVIGAWAAAEFARFLRDPVVALAQRATGGEWNFDSIESLGDKDDAFFVRSPAHGNLKIPQLEGGLERLLEPDGTFTLRFDRPVGNLHIKATLPFTVKADNDRHVFRLAVGEYLQGETYAFRIHWQAVSGEPLPPLSLQLSTPQPLTVKSNTENMTDLGLAYPLRLTFSERLDDRSKVKERLAVVTADGAPVAGSWRWIGKRRIQFTPLPAWPASTVINVSLVKDTLKSQQGGWLEQDFHSSFGTGTDRQIFVYLDTQQVTAVENGRVLKTFKVSTGKAKTPTVPGNFYIYDRYKRKTMRSRVPKGRPGYYLVEDVPYTQFFNGDMALHGAFWHNGFGRPASHGCVNMATRQKNTRWPHVNEDAGWLYNWASLGVPVTVFKEMPVEMAGKSDSLDAAPQISRRPE